MKYILAVCLMCVAVSALANPERVTLSDDIVAADTATIRADTVFGSWMQVPSNIRCLQFMVTETDDTAWGDDSTFFTLQWSPDRVNVLSTWNIDTLLATGVGRSVLNISPDDSIFGMWCRPRVIHKDSIGVGAGDSALVHRVLPFVSTYDFWIIQWKY
jgi:hypothetical protein